MISSPLRNEDIFMVIFQRKYKSFLVFCFVLKKRGSCCPLLIYRTLNLVTFFQIGNLPLLQESCLRPLNFPELQTFLKVLSSYTFVSQETLLFFIFSAMSNRKLYLGIKYYYIVCGLIFMSNFINIYWKQIMPVRLS